MEQKQKMMDIILDLRLAIQDSCGNELIGKVGENHTLSDYCDTLSRYVRWQSDTNTIMRGHIDDLIQFMKDDYVEPSTKSNVEEIKESLDAFKSDLEGEMYRLRIDSDSIQMDTDTYGGQVTITAEIDFDLVQTEVKNWLDDTLYEYLEDKFPEEEEEEEDNDLERDEHGCVLVVSCGNCHKDVHDVNDDGVCKDCE